MDNHNSQNGEPAFTNTGGDGVKSLERSLDDAGPFREIRENIAFMHERYSVLEKELSALTSRINDLAEQLPDLTLQIKVLQQAFSNQAMDLNRVKLASPQYVKSRHRFLDRFSRSISERTTSRPPIARENRAARHGDVVMEAADSEADREQKTG